jgi:hypothetical protein
MVSDITRAKYERVIQRCEEKGVWVYICKRNDGRVALVIPYHRESGVLAPPMMHRACDPGEADSDDLCDFLSAPCQADPWAFMNWGEFRRAHDRKIEPSSEFWDLMTEAIELRHVPEETIDEAV